MQTSDGGDLDYDVLIGGRPAGMSATLQLGHSHRSDLVCDTDEAVTSRTTVSVTGDASSLSMPGAVAEGSEGSVAVSLKRSEVTVAGGM